SLPQSEPERRKLALTRLYQDYWPPLYRFVRRRGYNKQDAQDLTQDFFRYLMEKKVCAASDRSKGRFRTFLLVLLKRYLGAARAFQCRKKRGGNRAILFLDDQQLNAAEEAEELSTGAPRDEERAFDWNWATALVGRAMEALNAEYSGGQKATLLTELRPF